MYLFSTESWLKWLDGGEPYSYSEPFDHLSQGGQAITLVISMTLQLLFFSSIPWVNNRLVTRHLFAVSGNLPSQKIEFGSKPADL